MTRLVLLLCLGCASRRPAPVEPPVPEAAVARFGEPWTHELRASHALVGRIWRVSEARFVTPDEVDVALAAADWRYLGEKHDNVDHHRLQAERIARLAPTGVVFEQLDDLDPIGAPATAAELGAAVGWSESGWPDFAMYEPVFAATLSAGARVLPGHPTRDQLRTAGREGVAALGEAAAGLALDRELPAPELTALSEEIVASHCGHADASMVEMMIRLQRLKDAWMARAMARHGAGAVLVAGAGHTREDRGVARYLDGTHASVAFVEVVEGELDPAAYAEGADFLWFTPRVDEDDPCEAFGGAP